MVAGDTWMLRSFIRSLLFVVTTHCKLYDITVLAHSIQSYQFASLAIVAHRIRAMLWHSTTMPLSMCTCLWRWMWTLRIGGETLVVVSFFSFFSLFLILVHPIAKSDCVHKPNEKRATRLSIWIIGHKRVSLFFISPEQNIWSIRETIVDTWTCKHQDPGVVAICN